MLKRAIYISLLAAGSITSSCTKILEQDPQNYLDASTAFTTESAVRAGLVGVYDEFQSTYYTGVALMILPELEGGNLTETGSYTDYQEIANVTISTNNTSTTNAWNYIYAGINRANNVISATNSITDASFTADEKKAVIAEASFLRAYMYFDLLRCYGGDTISYASASGAGVPIRLTPTTESSQAVAIARSNAGEVYTQVLKDLDTAIAGLSINLSSAGRADLNAAVALKARVQLYRESFDDAESLATQIINQFSSSTAYGGLAANYASIFSTKNTKPESIWEIQNTATDGTYLGYYYYGRSEVASNSNLAAAHESGDVRLTVNYNNSVSATKYRQLKFTHSDYSDNIPLIRLAEVYLIRAEARARKSTPDLTGALADVNMVRARAGLKASTATTVDGIVDAVLNERRVELAHEGQRFFDLRRLNKAKSALSISQGYRLLWPVPQSEINAGAGVVTQNYGY
ncbi:RagB/SusD domain-containing protein [Filimonas lacunae]|uniref:RagB/SusD domain-containing protein n=1 Tax=Filimonas lacunae TaxID=477680 RepID=A0A173MKA9_9BACT|nr:RagB/SusD family nutrient uptake outer membrane protein [Filimonas lacunae]BAV08034.1 outer membrane protein, nutrient binding [Filimonas lacunae]SIT08327.1 RagB/SusD domain-containing protein [Filimonas lacunae]